MLDRMRGALRAVLPAGAFLKLDRGTALFVTDAPRRGPCPRWPGFDCVIENGLARLTPDARWLRALEDEYPQPPDFLCAYLRRGGEPDDAALKLFALGLKRLNGATNDDYSRRLREAAAMRLRNHEGLGGFYACGILNHLIERKESA